MTSRPDRSDPHAGRARGELTQASVKYFGFVAFGNGVSVRVRVCVFSRKTLAFASYVGVRRERCYGNDKREV